MVMSSAPEIGQANDNNQKELISKGTAVMDPFSRCTHGHRAQGKVIQDGWPAASN